MHVCRDARDFAKRVSRASFAQAIEVSPAFTLTFHTKDKVKLDRPIYLGSSIMELSKVRMCEHHFRLVDLFGRENIRMAMTDTDSLLYDIWCEDPYQTLVDVADELDTTSFKAPHPLAGLGHNGEVGYLKDEMEGVPITCRLNPSTKVYLIESENGLIRKCKGVSKVVVNKLTKQDYTTAVGGAAGSSYEFSRIRSVNHQIYIEKVKKQALTGMDIKRFWYPDGRSLPYGHYRTDASE